MPGGDGLHPSDRAQVPESGARLDAVATLLVNWLLQSAISNHQCFCLMAGEDAACLPPEFLLGRALSDVAVAAAGCAAVLLGAWLVACLAVVVFLGDWAASCWQLLRRNADVNYSKSSAEYVAVLRLFFVSSVPRPRSWRLPLMHWIPRFVRLRPIGNNMLMQAAMIVWMADALQRNAGRSHPLLSFAWLLCKLRLQEAAAAVDVPAFMACLAINTAYEWLPTAAVVVMTTRVLAPQHLWLMLRAAVLMVSSAAPWHRWIELLSLAYWISLYALFDAWAAAKKVSRLVCQALGMLESLFILIGMVVVFAADRGLQLKKWLGRSRRHGGRASAPAASSSRQAAGRQGSGRSHRQQKSQVLAGSSDSSAQHAARAASTRQHSCSSGLAALAAWLQGRSAEASTAAVTAAATTPEAREEAQAPAPPAAAASGSLAAPGSTAAGEPASSAGRGSSRRSSSGAKSSNSKQTADAFPAVLPDTRRNTPLAAGTHTSGSDKRATVKASGSCSSAPSSCRPGSLPLPPHAEAPDNKPLSLQRKGSKQQLLPRRAMGRDKPAENEGVRDTAIANSSRSRSSSRDAAAAVLQPVSGPAAAAATAAPTAAPLDLALCGSSAATAPTAGSAAAGASAACPSPVPAAIITTAAAAAAATAASQPPAAAARPRPAASARGRVLAVAAGRQPTPHLVNAGHARLAPQQQQRQQQQQQRQVQGMPPPGLPSSDGRGGGRNAAAP